MDRPQMVPSSVDAVLNRNFRREFFDGLCGMGTIRIFPPLFMPLSLNLMNVWPVWRACNCMLDKACKMPPLQYYSP